jgi:quercetin dioxygenase-like cupin family protein
MATCALPSGVLRGPVMPNLAIVRSLAVTVALAACSQPAPVKRGADVCDEIGGGAPSVCPPRLPVAQPAPIDAPPHSQEEKLAAIQKAMNELDEAAQLCWAAAATDRFDIDGELALLIDIPAPPAAATVTVMRDTARNTKLARCLVQLLSSYHWAPPLHGDAIQLPFRFKAPDGQSVIDRALVEWHAQSSVSVAVLLDENNTGNGAASMFEVAIVPRASTGMRVAERAELWLFRGEVEVKSVAFSGANAKSFSTRAPAGSMMYVPRGSAREVIAARPDMRAVVVMIPGGREGSARAGALPTAAATTGVALPFVLESGKTFGPATIFLEPAVAKTAPMAASMLELGADARVPEHVHAKETELLYVLEGSGTMTIAGQDIEVTPTSVIQIPPNTPHAFVATTTVRALQVYTPPGPEQRFKAVRNGQTR